jgi:predicted DNA-binding protein (MmcQ/YjbR family)
MARSDKVLARLRKICLALPDTEETLTWDKPHFRVAGKIFAGYGEEGGRQVIGCKLKKEHASLMCRDPRFRPAPYVGKHGWVTMDTAGLKNWEEVRSLVLESYTLIAPKKSLAKLQAGSKKGRR